MLGSAGRLIPFMSCLTRLLDRAIAIALMMAAHVPSSQPLAALAGLPGRVLNAKKDYVNGQALVFQNIDYLMMTYRPLRKD